MATSGVKKAQQRIFGTGVPEGSATSDSQNEGSGSATPNNEAGSSGDTSGGGVNSTNVNQGPGLTLIIPKPKAPPTPLPKKPSSDPSPKAQAGEKQSNSGGDEDGVADVVDGEDGGMEYVPFRQRLAEKLGTEYKGAERYRLQQDDQREKHWKRWGPYLSDRQWVGNFLNYIYQFKSLLMDGWLWLCWQATVREDYSADGDAWSHFPHEHARSRAYRWGEDGMAGISDNHQRICFALSLWNGQDPILKERLYGVTGHQGNHGEDVKELYYYLDSTPTHSYMKYLYKYPQKRFPYEELVEENRRRDRTVSEFEILDTDVFDEDRYWDVFVEVCVLHSGPHLILKFKILA